MTKFTIRIADDDFEKVQRYAAESGVSPSEAIRALIERGLSTAVTKAEVEQMISAAVTQADAKRDRQAELMADAVKELGIARKNIGKATRASYGSLSMLSFLFKDFMSMFIADGVDNDRVKACDRLTLSEVFRLFDSSGGALQRDSGNYYGSFYETLKRPPYSEYGPEGMLGIDKRDFERLSGKSNDAAAMRSLERDRKRNGKGRRE